MYKKLSEKNNTLLKCVTLLYRELLISNESDIKDFSTELVGDILKTYKNDDIMENNSMGTNVMIFDSLKEYLHKLINNLENYSEEDIIDSITILLKEDKSLSESILTSLKKEMSLASLKRTIVALRLQLKSVITDNKIFRHIYSANKEMRDNNNLNVVEFTKNLILQLELLTSGSGDNIPGIVNEIDIEDNSMVNVLKSVQDLDDGSGKLKTGWIEMNEMLQGKLAPHYRNIVL